MASCFCIFNEPSTQDLFVNFKTDNSITHTMSSFVDCNNIDPVNTNINQVEFCNSYDVTEHPSILTTIGDTLRFVGVMIGIQAICDQDLRNSIFDFCHNIGNQIMSIDTSDNDADEDDEGDDDGDDEGDDEEENENIKLFVNNIQNEALENLNVSKKIVDQIVMDAMTKLQQELQRKKMKRVFGQLKEQFSDNDPESNDNSETVDNDYPFEDTEDDEADEADKVDEDNETEQISNELELTKAVNDSTTIRNRKKGMFSFRFW